MKNKSSGKHEESYGSPYSVAEARKSASIGTGISQYHSSLILWLCDEVERLRAENNVLNPVTVDKKELLFDRAGLTGHLFVSCFAEAFKGAVTPEVQKKLLDSKDISLVLVANGIPMDAIKVCEEWDKQVDAAVERKAAELVQTRFKDSKRRIDDMMDAVEGHVRDELAKAGINPNDCTPF